MTRNVWVVLLIVVMIALIVGLDILFVVGASYFTFLRPR